jgi:hypothetical protein
LLWEGQVVVKWVLTGWALLFLGAFLVVLGIAARFIGPGLSERTPLDVDSSTFYAGQAQKLNPSTGKVEDVPVKVLTRTKVDHGKSDGDVVVFVSYTCANVDRDNPPDCLKKDDDRLISNSTDTFSTDRHTAEAVNSSKYLPNGTTHEGLQNKWPFGTQKKDYQLWDGLLDKAVPVEFDSTTSIQGLKVYKFTSTVPKTSAAIAGDIQGTYASETNFLIEPTTGSIIKVDRHESRLLPDGSTVLDMSIHYTDATVKKNVDEGKANISQLRLISVWVPVIGVVGGVIALVGGFLLLRRARRTADTTTE